MAGAGHSQQLLFSIDEQQLRGNKHVHRGKFSNIWRFIRANNSAGWCVHSAVVRTSVCSCGRKQRRRMLSHHVRHDEQHTPASNFEHVVKIAPNMPRAQAKSCQAIAGDRREEFWTAGFLNTSGDFQFVGRDLQTHLFFLELGIDD